MDLGRLIFHFSYLRAYFFKLYPNFGFTKFSLLYTYVSYVSKENQVYLLMSKVQKIAGAYVVNPPVVFPI